MQCDGKDPSCGSCIVSDVECVYRMPNADLKQRLEELELAYKDVTQSIHDGRDAGEQIDAGMGETTRASLSSAVSSANTNYSSRQISSRGPSSEVSATLPLARWTTVSNDENLLNHLFTLFWTWESTLSRILSRELLIDSLSAAPDATSSASSGLETEFCSELLVNSILAISMV